MFYIIAVNKCSAVSLLYREINKNTSFTMDINGGSGGDITKSDIFNLIFFPRVFNHKVRM